MADLLYCTFNRNPLRDESMELKLDFQDVPKLNKFLSSGIQKVYFIQSPDSRLEIFRLLNIFKRLEDNGFNSDYLGPDNAALLTWDALKLALDRNPDNSTVQKVTFAELLKNSFGLTQQSDPTLKSLLIINAEEYEQDSNVKLTLKRLFTFLSNHNSKKAIVVSSKNFCFNCLDLKQKVQYHSEFSVYKSIDVIGFKDLNQDCQRFFLDLKCVYFQGISLSLEQFILIFGGRIDNIISGQVLKDITFDPTIPSSLIQIGQSDRINAEQEDFFKQCTFYGNFFISRQVKRLLASNLLSERLIFANVKSIQHLAEALHARGNNKKRILHNKHILTFERLDESISCYNDSKYGALHLISYDSNIGEFNWISSKNSLKNIRKYVARNHKTAVTLKDLIVTQNKSVILYGPSGSGKTYTLLKMQSLLPSSWVIYVDLVKYQRKIPKNIDQNSVIKFLSTYIEPYMLLTPGLLNQYLFHQSDLSLYVLFDSFDHITKRPCEDAYTNFLNLIIFLKNQSQAYIWVASSLDPYTQDMENALCDFRTIFASYQVDDSFTQVYQENKGIIRHSAHIIGLPLSLKMLLNGCIGIPEYIEKKFDFYMKEHFAESNFKDIVKYLYGIHAVVATKVAYPKLAFALPEKDKFHVNISNLGFVSDTTNFYSENNYRFENLVFADFFVAIRTIYKWMTSPECSMEELLFFDTFLKPEYKNIRFLLNSYIKENPLPPAPDQVSIRLAKMWEESKREFFNEQGKCAFHILAEEKLDFLAEWFFKGDFFKNFGPTVLSTNNLYKRVRKYNWAPNLKMEPSNDVLFAITSTEKNQTNRIRLTYKNKSDELLTPFTIPIVASLLKAPESVARCNIPVDILDKTGRTPLHYALKLKHMGIANFLISKRASLMTVNKQIKKAICYCVQNNDIEETRFLIENLLEDVNDSDTHGMSPLIYAAKSNNIDMAVLLINNKADINHIDDYGLSPLTWAVLSNNVQMVDLLTGAGADYTTKLRDGSNLLHIAVGKNSLNMVKYLTFSSFDLNHPNSQGITPLEEATRLHNWSIVNHLVLEGALTLNGFNPVNITADKCQWQLVLLLLSKGCSLAEVPEEKQLQILKEIDCSTPMPLIKLGNTELLNLLLQKDQVTDLHRYLSEPYEELRLRGVELNDNMKSFIEEKLVEMRSFVGQTVRLSKKGAEERKKLLLEQIAVLKYAYSSAKVDTKFIFRATFIAQNIDILKRGRKVRIKGGYENADIPWEQMEFIIIIFIDFFKNPRDDDFEFRLILDQKRLLVHLECFARMLQSHLDGEPNKTLKDLEADYRILKDIYSLQRISKYIKLAISLETNEEINIFALMRALQVVGEYLKNTDDSLNVSHETLNYLLRFAPINIQNILTTLRDAMLHPSKSKQDIENTLKNDKDYFDCTLNELRKLRLQIDFLLYKKKSESLNIFLKKCTEDEDRDILNRYINWKADSNITKEDYEIRDLMDIKAFINQLKRALPEPSVTEQELLYKISKEIQKMDEIIYESLNKTKKKYFDSRLLFNDIESTVQLPGIEEQGYFTYCTKQREGIYNGASNLLIDLHGMMQTKCDKSREDAIKICSELIYMMKWGLHQANTIQDIYDNLTTNDELIESSLKEIFNEIISDLDGDDKETLQKHLTDNILLHENLCNLKISYEEVVNIIDDLNIPQKNRANLQKNLINPIVFQNMLTEITQDLGQVETAHAKFLQLFECLKLPKKERQTFNRSFEEGVANIDKYAKLTKTFKTDKFFSNLLQFCSTLKNTIINAAVEKYMQRKEDCFRGEFSVKLDLVSTVIKNKREVKNNPVYQAAIEILLLDLMTALATKQSLIEYDLSYDENAPLLVGKSLRNYLAHGTPLIDIMPYNPINAILSTIGIIERIYKNKFKKAPEAKPYKEDRLLHYFEQVSSLSDRSGKFEILKPNKPLYVEYLESAASNDINKTNHISNSLIGYTGFYNSILIWPALIVAAKNGHFNIVKALHEGIKNVRFTTNISFDSFKKAACYLKPYSINLNRPMFNESVKAILPRCGEFYINTALREAVNAGHHAIVELLLVDCKNIHFVDSNHDTLLHIAAEKGNDKVIEALLKYNANTKAVTKKLLTPLHTAAYNGHYGIVELLLNNGAPVDAQTIDRLSALHYAAIHGYVTITETLLKHNASVNLESSDGLTPLHLSVENNHVKTTELLLKYHADVNKTNLGGNACLVIAAANSSAQVVEHLLKYQPNIETDWDSFTPLHAAAYRGRHEIVKMILSNRPELKVDHYFKGMLNALQLAAISDSVETMQVLLDFGANIESANENGMTALHTACQHGQRDTVNLLLNKQADINAVSCLVGTPLFLAASHGHHEIVEELLKRKAKTNFKNSEGRTALHESVLNGHRETVSVLLKYNTNIDKTANDNSKAIHFAASKGNCEIIKALIEHGADVNAKTDTLFRPLHLAAQNNHIEVAKILLQYKADVNALAIDEKTTPLAIAVQNGNTKMVKILIQNGANTWFPKEKNPAVFEAIRHRREEVLWELLKSKPTDGELSSVEEGCTPLYMAAGCGYLTAVDILLKYNVNVNAATNNGLTALHFASQEGFKAIAARLLDHNANVRARSKLKYTPLHMAADKGRKELVVMLLDHDANIEDKCFKGGTALHYSAEEGHAGVVKVLLDRKADVNAIMNDGTTALHKAVENNRSDLIEMLLEKGARINDFREIEAGFETALDIAEKNNKESIRPVLEKNGAKRFEQLL